VTGPLKSGNLIITDADGGKVAHVPATWPDARPLAELMARAGVRSSILEIIHAELKADDEGHRWGDLLNLIETELEATGWTPRISETRPAPAPAPPGPLPLDVRIKNLVARAEGRTCEDVPGPERFERFPPDTPVREPTE
jgi:hypothetical protein